MTEPPENPSNELPSAQVTDPPSDPVAETAARLSTESEQARVPARKAKGLRGFAEGVGLVPPRGQSDPYAHRRGEPRGFTVIWLSYLFLTAGAVYAAIGNPAFASAEGYRLASKVLLTMVGVGVLTVWPVLRLTQRAALAGGVSATLRDVAIVLIPMQALIWPQSLITGWTVPAVGAIALMLAAWTLLVGAIIAAVTGPARRSARSVAALSESPHAVAPAMRTGAMAVVLGLGLAGPAVLMLLPPGEADGRRLLAMCSPITAPWELFADRSWMGRRSVTLPEHWKPVLLTLIVGLAAWGVLLLTRRTGPLEDRSASA